MRTAVTDMFGIEYPIFAFSHCRDVVAAVSRAGGFGVLGATAHTPERLAEDLRWVTEAVAGAPFGVDVLLPTTHATQDTGGSAPLPAELTSFVNELLSRHGVEPLDFASGRLGRGEGFTSLVDPEGFAERLLDVAFTFPIRLVASALGPPPVGLVDAAHQRGVQVAALAGRVSHARRHVAAGVDLVVAQGYEAGGHTGEIATMVLVPEVVDAVHPVPVLAAGGVARGRQMAAALALGAQGVWCGSVWLTTEEAETSAVVKRRFLAAGSADTVRSRSRTGKPARQLRSAWTDAWEGPGAPRPLPLPVQYRLAEPALARSEAAAEAGNESAAALTTYFVGQVVGAMNQVKPTRQVVFDIARELADAVEELAERLAEEPLPG